MMPPKIVEIERIERMEIFIEIEIVTGFCSFYIPILRIASPHENA